MSNPAFIMVLGLPATGKTQLAKKLAAQFHLPLISKDDIKEIIFDGLGWHDRAWSKKAGRTTFALIDYILEGQLKAGNSIIVESPYDPTFQNEKLQRWQRLSTTSMPYRSSAMPKGAYYLIGSSKEVTLYNGTLATQMPAT